MLQVIDHNEEKWAYRHRRIKRENGASTYSKDIVIHHIPVWAEHVNDLEVSISTCPKMTGMALSGDLAVQYLHEYKYDNPLNAAIVIHRELKHNFKRVIFVTAYKSLAFQLISAGFEAWHIPMAIDTELVVPVNRLTKKGPRTAAYFGNILGPKVNLFKKLLQEFGEASWSIEQVKGPQYTSWQDLTQFEYGIGVGRCALEMQQLGLKVMIAGSEFGGIMTNRTEWELQRDTNFNGRIITFDRSIQVCVQAWEHSVTGMIVDVKDAVAVLRGHLKSLQLGPAVPSVLVQ